MTREEAAARYLYANGVRRMACPDDEDGAPTCMGDTGYCGFSPELGHGVCVHLDEAAHSVSVEQVISTGERPSLLHRCSTGRQHTGCTGAHGRPSGGTENPW